MATPCPDFYCADPNCTQHPTQNWCGPCGGWIDGEPCDEVAHSITDEFIAWLRVGLDRGWVSDVVCATHDGVPTTEQEDGEIDEGWDPCIPVVRIWESAITS